MIARDHAMSRVLSDSHVGLFIRQMAWALTIVTAMLLAAYLVQELSLAGTSPQAAEDKLWLLDINKERVPFAWFSSVALFTDGLIACGIGSVLKATARRDWAYWLLIGAGFVFLGLDEGIGIHEKLGDHLPIGWGKHLGVKWVIVAVPAVLVCLVVLTRFLSRVPRGLLLRFLISGFVFVCGAVGVEVISARLYGVWSEDVEHQLLVFIEETLEVAGVLMFMFALARFCDLVLFPGQTGSLAGSAEPQHR